MQCPVCKTVELAERDLETNLQAMQCPECGGQWIDAVHYWHWRELQEADLPEKPAVEGLRLAVAESDTPKLCPECGVLLIRYKVGHELDFALERCGHCGGVWFDANEWEILKSRNLHDDVHFIFSHVWQAEVFREERRREREKILLAKFGADDLAEIRRIKAWLDNHPHRNELLALLMHPGE